MPAVLTTKSTKITKQALREFFTKEKPGTRNLEPETWN